MRGCLRLLFLAGVVHLRLLLGGLFLRRLRGFVAHDEISFRLTYFRENISQEAPLYIRQFLPRSKLGHASACGSEPQFRLSVIRLGRRAKSRQPSFVEIQEKDLPATFDSQDSDSELLTALDEALLALSPNERDLIEETYLNARRQSDLASERGLSLKALESRLTRLRRKLRQLIVFPPRDE